MRTEIDMKTYRKRNQYEWFHTFPDPTYGFDVDIDVTNVVHLAKKKGISFFESFLYFILMAVNEVPEMRMREVQGQTMASTRTPDANYRRISMDSAPWFGRRSRKPRVFHPTKNWIVIRCARSQTSSMPLPFPFFL